MFSSDLAALVLPVVSLFSNFSQNNLPVILCLKINLQISISAEHFACFFCYILEIGYIAHITYVTSYMAQLEIKKFLFQYTITDCYSQFHLSH